MMKRFSKIIIGLSLILGIGSALMSPAMFTANAAAETLKETTFQVTKYLDLDSGKEGGTAQGQSYFGGGKTSPTIEFILTVITIAVKVAGTLAVTMMIITGLAMVLSQGNQNMIEKSKQMFLYEILGLVVIFVSYVVVTFVQSIFTTG